MARSKDEHANTFANLGVHIPTLPELIDKIVKYVCHLYGHENESDVNLVRYHTFKLRKFEEELLRPNGDSLRIHINRAAFQCRIWRNATLPRFNTGNFTEHGWELDEDGVVNIKWMNLPPAPASFLELMNCKCTKGCGNNRCSCRKSSLKCTELCKCHECQNREDDDNDEPDDSDSYDCSQSSESDEE